MHTFKITVIDNHGSEQSVTLTKTCIDKESLIDWLPRAFNGLGCTDVGKTLTACLADKAFPNQEISYLNLCKEVNTYIEVLRELDKQEDESINQTKYTNAKVKGLTGFIQQLKMTMEDMG